MCAAFLCAVVPQGLKPESLLSFYAGLKACSTLKSDAGEVEGEPGAVIKPGRIEREA